MIERIKAITLDLANYLQRFQILFCFCITRASLKHYYLFEYWMQIKIYKDSSRSHQIQLYSPQSNMNSDNNQEPACPGCNRVVPINKIKQHIQSCNKYPLTIYKEVKRFDHKIPANLIKFLKIQLDMSRQYLQKLLPQDAEHQKEYQGINNILRDIQNRKSNTPKPSNQANKMKEQVQLGADMLCIQSKIVVCKNCDRKYYQNFDRDILFYVYDCWHVFCLPCVNKYIDNQFINQGGNLKCLDPSCNKHMLQDQIRGLITNQKYETLYNKTIRKMYNITQCFKCKTQFEFAEGNPKDAPKKDNNGKELKQEHAKDYATNRFICPTAACKTEQCRSCQATPYHLGMLCKDYKDRALLKKCRYCDEPLTEKNASLSKVKALADICNSKDCQQLAKHACEKVLGCGHSCNGFKNEKNCLPCLNEKCAQKCADLNGVNGDQYCAICYVEALSASPCVRSGCGHIFHVKCIKKRFEIKWLTPRIFFNFCLCPLCKKWITVSPESQLHKYSQENRILYQKIQFMALQRLKFEQLQKNDQKLKQKTSIYFGKPKQYAMAIYAYFLCFKCKTPYFGGRKDCMAAMNQANAGGSFKAQQLICPNCCEIPVQNCPQHGKDFIQFKCKFCCSIAQWFCWGNTHFCQPCHKRQCNGDYVSKYTKEQLPKCNGPGKCPIGGNHSGNGQQKMMGCAICRNIKQNHKSF